MRSRTGRLFIIWALLLATLYVGERVYRTYTWVEYEPRPILAAGRMSDWERTNIEIFQAAAPSVVSITTEQLRFSPFAGFGVAQGAGSGFIWDAAGHIVTNHHVIAGATNVYVQLDVGKPIPARVVGSAPDYDLAVVRLRDPPRGLRPLPLGTSQDLHVGQATYAIGNPFGLRRTLTTGIVSALERRLPTAGGREVRGVIQTDAAINPGNSGGPLLDGSGRLIGVNTAIITETGAFAGIGFAIPVDLVNRVVPQIIKTGRAPRPGLGISVADAPIAAQLGVSGVLVLDVAPGSPAEAAGLRPFKPGTKEPGDVIVAAAGKPVESVADLAAVLDEVGIGNEVTLRVQRGEMLADVNVRIIDLGA
jgi:2-alkenal reductase